MKLYEEFKKEYGVWIDIKRRCYDETRSYYKWYGGRGISVCREWLDSFEVFLRDVGPAPDKTYTLDRVDNNKNYEPGNVRWATVAEQANNKRSNVTVVYNGEVKTAAQVAPLIGVDGHTLRARLRSGWSEEQALSKPARSYGLKLTFNGETHSILEWSKLTGISASTIKWKLKRGISIEHILTKDGS